MPARGIPRHQSRRKGRLASCRNGFDDLANAGLEVRSTESSSAREIRLFDPPGVVVCRFQARDHQDMWQCPWSVVGPKACVKAVLRGNQLTSVAQ